MKLNLELARLAIKLEQFQKFMQDEIKITDGQLKELMACGSITCWSKFEWRDRTIGTINEELVRLDLDGNLKAPQPTEAIHKLFKSEEKNEALKFVSEAEGYSFQIILRKKT